MSNAVQLAMFSPARVQSPTRVVHYLGSKLRFLDRIVEAVRTVAPDARSVCDLFAGSGVVSSAFSDRWSVTSVDIQEYSRVLCSAVLGEVPSSITHEQLHERRVTSQLAEELGSALHELIQYEQDCLRAAHTGEIDPICEIVEHGSLLHEQDAPSLNSSNHLVRLLQSTLKRLRQSGLDRGPASVITRYFGGTYFSWRQAVELDLLLASIHELDAQIRDFYLAAALSAASDVVNTVGKQFAQPIRPRTSDGVFKAHLVNQIIRDRTLSVPTSFREATARLAQAPRDGRSHRVLRADFKDALSDQSVKFDAVYADPPYTRDHYSRFYHVLETMSLRDEPCVSTTKIRSQDGGAKMSRGSYRADRHQSPFCIKSQAPNAFAELFRLIAKRGVPLVLSYSPYSSSSANRPRLMRIEQLVELAQQVFAEVRVETVAGIAHNKLNEAKRNVVVDYDAEALIVCR